MRDKFRMAYGFYESKSQEYFIIIFTLITYKSYLYLYTEDYIIIKGLLGLPFNS